MYVPLCPKNINNVVKMITRKRKFEYTIFNFSIVLYRSKGIMVENILCARFYQNNCVQIAHNR